MQMSCSFSVRFVLSTGFAGLTLTVLIFGWRGMEELPFDITVRASPWDIRGDKTLSVAYAA